MRYSINLEQIKKKYKYNEEKTARTQIIHTQPEKIKLFPFNTGYVKKSKKEKSIFTNFIGEFARKALDIVLNKSINKNEILDKMITNLKDLPKDKNEKMKLFFDELFFDNVQLAFSHPKLVFRLEKNDVPEISYFLVDVFMEETKKEFFRDIYEGDEKEDDVLLQILLKSLPELKVRENHKSKSQKYYNKFILFKKIFNEDFDFLIKNDSLFIENFEDFLKFYYFIYISQFLLKLNKFFDADLKKVEEIYFNLNTEKTSKTRISYQNGWKLLELKSISLFTHSHVLEMLNTSNNDDLFIYSELEQEYNKLNEIEKEELLIEIDQLINWYKSVINDVSWNLFNDIQNNERTGFKDKIILLFKIIDFQFKNSDSRKTPYNNYIKWFTEFAKEFFLKRRGSLGYTLNLTEDYIFLLTKLAIKNKENIRLTDLFIEFEKRGVFFDKDSKENLKDLYEKLNLLDKKSDSGDAIYVKSII